jgi:hypothetical protein
VELLQHVVDPAWLRELRIHLGAAALPLACMVGAVILLALVNAALWLIANWRSWIAWVAALAWLGALVAAAFGWLGPFGGVALFGGTAVLFLVRTAVGHAVDFSAKKGRSLPSMTWIALCSSCYVGALLLPFAALAAAALDGLRWPPDLALIVAIILSVLIISLLSRWQRNASQR